MAHRDLNKTFAENLRKLRIEKGYSLRDLEKEAGVTNVYICEIEKHSKHPTLVVIDKLARALGSTASLMIKGPM
jgi:transcriptional regulator with XRE-family HTH domain